MHFLFNGELHQQKEVRDIQMGQETCHIAKQIHQISARPLEALDHSLPVLTENNAQPKTSELFLISGQN